MSNNKSTESPNARQKRSVEREKREATQRRTRWLLMGGGLLAIMVVGALLLTSQSAAPSAATAGRIASPPADNRALGPATVTAGTTTSPSADARALGPASAPVTIVEYGDFGCTTCRAWHNAGILNQVRSTYGDKVHFVWRDFPVITPQSPKAAEAGHCAADQGKFWEYHDLLYARQPAIDVDSLKRYAAQMGLDVGKFNQCLDSGQYQAEVNRDLQDAFARHFTGTPSFLINDKPLAGPPSFEMLQSLIDPILAHGG